MTPGTEPFESHATTDETLAPTHANNASPTHHITSPISYTRSDHVRSRVRRSGAGGDGVQRLGADVLLRVPLWRQVRDLPRGSVRRRGHRAVSQLHAANQGPLRRERTPGAETRGGRRGRARARQPRRRTGCRGIDARRGAGVGVHPACRLSFWLECLSWCLGMFLLHRDLLVFSCLSIVW